MKTKRKRTFTREHEGGITFAQAVKTVKNLRPGEQIRTVRLSSQLLMEMFTQGKQLHFRIEKGLPGAVEILKVTGTPEYVDFIVKGHFTEGEDGEIFNITATTI